jgi:hypothetical protein
LQGHLVANELKIAVDLFQLLLPKASLAAQFNKHLLLGNAPNRRTITELVRTGSRTNVKRFPHQFGWFI